MNSPEQSKSKPSFKREQPITMIARGLAEAIPEWRRTLVQMSALMLALFVLVGSAWGLGALLNDGSADEVAAQELAAVERTKQKPNRASHHKKRMKRKHRKTIQKNSRTLPRKRR